MTQNQNRKCLKYLFLIAAVYAVGYVVKCIIDRRGRIRLQKSPSRLKENREDGNIHNLGTQFMLNNELMYDSIVGNSSAKTLEQLRFETNSYLPAVSCRAILDGQKEEIETVKLNLLEFKSQVYEGKRKKVASWDDTVVGMTTNCTEFKRNRQYVTRPLTAEEKNYPVAYVITIHRDIGSFERLFRAVYHPQNVYCVHVDGKSDKKFLRDVEKVLGCFDNAFIASRLTKVFYSHYSRVQADLNCLKDLIERRESVPWKYVINLCGLDFPLKTNFEIVRSLKSLYGFNNVESISTPEHKKQRYNFRYELPTNRQSEHEVLQKTDVAKDPVPIDTKMFAGSAYYILTHKAVQVILTDPEIAKFLAWNKDTYSPDEHVWATLQRLHHILPGSYSPHSKFDMNELQTITRLVKWGGMDPLVYPVCSGVYVRGICVYGVGDLAWLVRQHHLFANKFDSTIDPYAIDCLDLWLRNKTIGQTLRYYKKGFI